jgi:hypothetical protein
MHGWLGHFWVKRKNRFMGPTCLSQPALGWLKVWYDVYKHLYIPSLFGYRLAVGYFRSEERWRGGEGVRDIRAFVVSLGVTVCYFGFDFLY